MCIHTLFYIPHNKQLKFIKMTMRFRQLSNNNCVLKALKKIERNTKGYQQWKKVKVKENVTTICIFWKSIKKHLVFYENINTCGFTVLWLTRHGYVHVDKPGHTYNPCPSKETYSKTQQASETSATVFYEKASTFLPSGLIYTAVCGGKEPLREESLIIGTQCP